jgi:hypothetical protein
VEFTGVELATPVEKAMAGLLEKAAAGKWRGELGGRWVVVLWHGGGATWQTRGVVESTVAAPRWRGGVWLWSRGDLSQRCHDVSFFRMVGSECMSI